MYHLAYLRPCMLQNECSSTSLPPSPLLSLRAHPNHASSGLESSLTYPGLVPRPRPNRRPHHSLETTSESDEMDDVNDDPVTHLSRQPVSQLATTQHSPSRIANGHHGAKYQSGVAVKAAGGSLAPMPEVCRAIKDYQPEHFSRSGHQRLELSLKEGDTVKVLGGLLQCTVLWYSFALCT